MPVLGVGCTSVRTVAAVLLTRSSSKLETAMYIGKFVMPECSLVLLPVGLLSIKDSILSFNVAWISSNGSWNDSKASLTPLTFKSLSSNASQDQLQHST